MRHYAKLLRATLTALVMLAAIAEAAVAGSLEDALAAHRRGDYETEYRLVRPLAEQGNATAQAVLGAMYHDGEGTLRRRNGGARQRIRAMLTRSTTVRTEGGANAV
jgi:hypothetical protein